MISGAELFLGGAAIAAVACLVFRRSAKRRFLRGRQPLAVAEIVSDLPETVGRDEASEVLQAIGKSFGVQPEILRLDDPMSALTGLDSWTLGHGQGELERWLRARGVSDLQRKPNTIRELIVSVLPFDANQPGAAR